VGILSNNYRDTLGAVKFYGATASNGSYPYLNTPSTTMPGAARNIFATDAGISSLSSKPQGARHPVAWQMPQKPGGLASHNATFVTLDETGFAVSGLPGSGSSTITFTETATGGLIVSGVGSATITFSETGTLISVAAGSGSSTITLSGSAVAGAFANIAGTTNITITPAAVIYAVGYLAGTASNESEFSPDALARAVWDALTINANNPGTMGEAVQAALAAAGDPWGIALPGTYPDGTAGNIVGQKLLRLSKFLALK
jgi:hypothetical protein